MKKSFVKMLKKSVSTIIAAAMSLSLFTTIPVSADIGRITYNYDGYSVDYNITNEWDGAQTVELTVSNTGTDPILNWALKYDAKGEISGLWNANVYSLNADEYVIKNVGWNFEIAPNQSVTYGYTLNGSNLALPENFEIYSKRVDKTEGYDVQYNITKSWETGVEGNIVITNTSDAPIEAWTLSFDSNFTIDNLWDGRVLENNGTSYAIAAEMWTNPVQPNSSMSIGFVGSKAADVEALLSNFRLTEVVIGEGGTVTPIDPPVEEIEITADAEYDEESGNINVSWTSNKQDGIFDILMSEDGENFVSVGTVENASDFVYAPENDFETLYFKVIQTVGDKSAESNVVAVAKSAEDIAISAEAVYDEENDKTMIIKWTSTNPDGIFDLFISNDGENYVLLETVENISQYLYTYADDFDTLYFKVKQTVGAKSAESNVAKISFFIDWENETDIDGDGLSDVYEKYYYETDPENPDTDGDGLPDGYEVYTLGTDPLMLDSDENGLSDAYEDFDEDGLTNIQEYNIGTDPKYKDTDGDNLSDYDEVYVHNTDPLKFDSDGDFVSDGDEVALGLDPNNFVTNGIPDNERTFEQKLDADDFNFYFVNIADNPFEVSIEINAAGVAENNLGAEISGYSHIMKNSAILGVAPEFSYTDNLKINDVKINFDLDSSIIENTNGKYTAVSDEFVGIKRFNVFKYFEDNNMLLPVETFHDVENNRVYAHTDELGTYCLVDMEIWLDNLGITADAEQAQSMFKVSRGKNLDVIFVVYSNAGFLKYTKAELIDAARAIFEESEKQNVTARLHFVAWTGGIYLNNNSGTYYAENIEDATAMINSSVSINTANLDPTVYMLTKAITGIRENMTEDFLENSEKYCFIIDSNCSPACSTTHGGIKALKDTGMDFSFVYSPFNTNAANYSALSSNNSVHQMVAGNGRLAFWEFIFEHLFDVTDEPFKIISSAGLVELPNDFGDISLDSDQDYDNDGLLDAEEIYFDATDKSGKKLITINANNTISLPNFNECVAVGGTYIESGLDRFYDEADESILNELDSIMVLPIMSDPTSEDGDGDGILDLTEYRIMQKVKNSAVAFTAKNNENNEAVSTDEMINTAKTNTIVDLYNIKITYSDFLNDINLYNVKIHDNNDYEFETPNRKPKSTYTLAREKLVYNNNKVKDSFKYGIIGKESDAYYIEACAETDKEGVVTNYLRITVNVMFSDNLNCNDDKTLKQVRLATEEDIKLVNDSSILNTNTLDENIITNDKEDEYIDRNEIIKKLKEKWSGNYKGSVFDFYEGMEINVSFRVNVIENIAGTNVRNIDTTKSANKIDSDYNGQYTNVILEEFDISNFDFKTTLNPNTQRSLKGSPTVTLYTVKYDTRVGADLECQTKEQITSACAHEFGHVFGLMDAYGRVCELNYYIEPVSFEDPLSKNNTITEDDTMDNKYEIAYDKNGILGKNESGEMMHRNGRISTNDIEMILCAKDSKKYQCFVPLMNVSSTDDYAMRSPAIKTNFIYRAYKENIQIGIDDIKSYYYFENGKYIKIDDTSKLVNILSNEKEDLKEYYLGYINAIFNSTSKDTLGKEKKIETKDN